MCGAFQIAPQKLQYHRNSTTMIGEMEWSATGRAGASLAEYSASRDVAFAFARAKSRLKEMQGVTYQEKREKILIRM